MGPFEHTRVYANEVTQDETPRDSFIRAAHPKDQLFLRVGIFSPTSQPLRKRGAGDWIIKTREEWDLECWGWWTFRGSGWAARPERTQKLLPYFSLCVSSTLLFLSCILYNKQVILSKGLSWVLSHPSGLWNLGVVRSPTFAVAWAEGVIWNPICGWHPKGGKSCWLSAKLVDPDAGSGGLYLTWIESLDT